MHTASLAGIDFVAVAPIQDPRAPKATPIEHIYHIISYPIRIIPNLGLEMCQRQPVQLVIRLTPNPPTPLDFIAPAWEAPGPQADGPRAEEAPHRIQI